MFPTDHDFESEFTFESSSAALPDDPPFHILMLGDWSGDGAKKGLSERRPIEIDRDNFDEIIEKLNVSLSLDLFGDDKDPLALDFSEIDDFSPDALFRKVSLFTDLREIRRRLSDTETFEKAANEVRSWFSNNEKLVEDHKAQQRNDAAQMVETHELLDMILSNPNDSSSTDNLRVVDNSELGRFVSNIVSPHLINIDENEQSNLISAVDETISQLMRTILHHPKFQALESAWRGLYFLVRRIEANSDLKIFIFDVSKAGLADNLKSVKSLDESFLYRQLMTDLPQNVSGKSFCVVGGNYSFGLNVDDTAALIRIGKISYSAKTPFISHLKPEIFGFECFSESIDTLSLSITASADELKLWNSLRSLPESQAVVLSPMRLLARLPYGEATDSIDTFSFEEFTNARQHSDYLWFNPSFALLLLLAQSFRRFGWDMADHLQVELNNFPLHYYNENGETKTKSCAEISLTETGLETIIEQGLIPLISFRNSDVIRVGRLQSISASAPKLHAKWFS